MGIVLVVQGQISSFLIPYCKEMEDILVWNITLQHAVGEPQGERDVSGHAVPF